MTISHHLEDATVLAYAAGTLPDALTVVGASHVAMCGTCRAAVRKAEAVGAELMAANQQAVSDMCRAATLASLDAITPAVRRTAAPLTGELPVPLARLVGDVTLKELPWKKKGPGLSLFEVPMPEGAKGKLMFLNIAPGRSMPEHGHSGEELTLVLKGSYSDKFGRFGAGDIADLDQESEHTPVTDSTDGCICVSAIESPTLFKPFWAKLMQPFVGI